MHGDPNLPQTLAARLLEAFLPLIKGSQAEVMAVTAELDLSLSQLRILFELERTGKDLAVNDLAERISLSMAAAGRAIDALFRSGLLSRREDENDRRIKRIGLTDRGRSIIAEIMRLRHQTAERFVNALNAEERADLEKAVATVAALIAAHSPAIHGECCTPSSSKEPAE
jgi:DNA-binding MarR family transcriptional regulator